MNNVYGPDTVGVNYAQFWLSLFRSGNFDVKNIPYGRLGVENIDDIIGNRRVRPSCKNKESSTMCCASTAKLAKSDLYWQQLDRLK